MTLFLPHGELVAQAWLRGVPGVPTNGVGTTLPADNTTWAASGFVQIEGAGGVPDPDLPFYQPLMTIRCWANRPGSAKPDWGKANQIAELIKIGGYGNVDSLAPAQRIVQLSPAFQNARVLAAYAVTEPRRIISDEARFAQYQMEMQFVYVPTDLPATTGPVMPISGKFIFHETTPSSSWIIHHNLGFEVQVTIWDDTGEVVYPEVDNPDLNTTVVTFAAPTTGTAIIS